jgi:hypothetical protein
MTKRELKSQPTWRDVKDKLAAFDRIALVDLIHHLYAADQSNQAFLHARPRRGRVGAVQGNPRALALARSVAQSGHVRV